MPVPLHEPHFRLLFPVPLQPEQVFAISVGLELGPVAELKLIPTKPTSTTRHTARAILRTENIGNSFEKGDRSEENQFSFLLGGSRITIFSSSITSQRIQCDSCRVPPSESFWRIIHKNLVLSHTVGYLFIEGSSTAPCSFPSQPPSTLVNGRGVTRKRKGAAGQPSHSRQRVSEQIHTTPKTGVAAALF